MIMIGTIFNYGTINIYIAKRYTPDTPYQTSTYTTLVFPLWLTSQILSTQLFRLRSFQKLGLRPTIFLGFSLFATINWAAPYLPCVHSFILFYSIGAGLSLGAVTLIPTYLLWNHFLHKIHFYNLVILGILSLSIAIISPISTFILNPRNLAIGEYDLDKGSEGLWGFGDRVELYFAVKGTVCGCFAVILVLVAPGKLSFRRELYRLIEVEAGGRRRNGSDDVQLKDKHVTLNLSGLKKESKD
jgi:hypothetical protein